MILIILSYLIISIVFSDETIDVSTSIVKYVEQVKGAVLGYSWSSNTLRYTTPSTSYLNMHVSVEYHIYDGGTVVFDTTTQSL